MKANGFFATLALAVAVIVAAPAAALAVECASTVTGGVTAFLAEGNATACAAASDAGFRIQEAMLEEAPSEDKSVTEAPAPEVADAALSHTADGAAADADEKVLAPRSLSVGGEHIPYVDSYKTASAPAHGAGLWLGEDSTTDGEWGYFIGHNPGDFAPVMDLVEGDTVAVCDSDAKAREYTVVDIFDVAEGTYWHEIEQRVSGYGESVILQACCGDGAHYRVVVAV